MAVYNNNLFLIFFSDGHKMRARVRSWKTLGEGDIKIFLAHLFAMGLVRQSSMERYWEHGEIVRTPFFGTYMSRNTFQNILSNFQISDSAKFTEEEKENDKLYKLRPLLDMMDRNFRHSYRPGRDLSVDEGTCPYKGRLSFKLFNPSKPARWHIKYYALNDSQTGFCLGFEVYSGPNLTRCANNANVLHPQCTETTKIVFGLMQKCDVLDLGHQLYMDNYYSSPELYEELYVRKTFCTGTLKLIRKGLSESCKHAKLKIGESCWRRKGPLLMFKWKEKKSKQPVRMISTIHQAVMVQVPQKENDHRERDPVWKPEAVYHYCKKMGGVDLNDQLLNYYTFLRKSMKWDRKLAIHFFNLIVLNAYILNKLYGSEKLTHDQYRDKLIKHLLADGITCYKIPLPPVISRKVSSRHAEEHEEKRLHERHFPASIPRGEGRKRSRPCRVCVVCNNLPDFDLPTKRTSFWCPDCGKPLCISPCFELYHTKKDYKTSAVDFRVKELVIPVSPT